MGAFQLDIRGQVRNMSLSESKALWPLFEAVVNSIQAIEESPNRDKGKITIFAKRESYTQLTLAGEASLERFVEFSITDNGIGLNEENYRSFNTAYSTLKIQKGCKGIGRFLWLKAFDNVEINSTYEEDGKNYQRNFCFNVDGISPDDNLQESNDNHIGTTVTLKGFKNPFKNAISVPVDLDALAKKIIEHCLTFFIVDNCPSIILKDGVSDDVNLNNYYETNIKDTLHQDKMTINGLDYTLYHLRLREGGNGHRIHFCANGLEVNYVELKNYIPNLQKRIKTDDESFYYDGYVTGEYLDSIVNASRTGFEFDEESDQHSFVSTDRITIINSAVEYIKAYLSDYLEDIEKQKRDQINHFVANDYPRYRYMLNQYPEMYDKIPAGLKASELEMALHKCVQERETEIRKQGLELEKAIDGVLLNSNISYDELFEEYWKGVTEMSKTCLAEYVTRRQAILKMLEEALTIQDNGRFKKEEVIHTIICPMRHTSDDVLFEEMNLWVIDERMAYHQFLASDKTIKSLPEIDSRSTKELDLAIFDRAFAYSEDESPLNTITIVEFKKPDNTKDNPLDQMGGYIDEIVSGKKKRANGMTFGNCNNTAFRCYAICDITEKMKSHCKTAGLRRTPDGEGFYGYWSERNAYVEVISYQKLLSDAKKRNEIFFVFLFYPKVSEIGHFE